MRLRKHLNEITIVTDKEINDIIDPAFSTFSKLIGKTKWKTWPIIYMYLHRSFVSFGISILPKFITNFGALRKHKDNIAVTFPGGLISIFITLKELKGLKSKSGIKGYKKKVKEYLRHEITHVKQYSKVADDAEEYERIKPTLYHYYADKTEIEAWARDAVEELRSGKSEVISTYSLINISASMSAFFLVAPSISIFSSGTLAKKHLYSSLQ